MSRSDVVDVLDPPAERFVDESCLRVEDLPDWPEDYDAFVADQIAADEASRSRRATSDVLASLERAAIDRMTIGQLVTIDPTDLDDHDLVGYAVVWSRVMNHAAGQVARAAVGYHDRVGHDEVLGRVRLTAAEFGAALRLGSGTADQLVHTSIALSRRLPATFAAVLSGDVSWAKAVALAERIVALTSEQSRRVEELVLPRAAERTPAQHANAVRRAVDRVDPYGAAERRRKAERDIALVRTHVGDGMGQLFARLPSEQLDTVWTAADAWARRAKAAGEPGTLDQLRVRALVRWAESFLTHGDPATCDTYCDPLDNPRTQSDAKSGSGDDDGTNDDEPGIHEPASDDGRTDRPPRNAKVAPDDPPRDEVAPNGPPRNNAPSDGSPRNNTPPEGSRTPMRHGRPVAVRVIWDLHSLLGLADRPGEMADSGATLTASTMRDLVGGGVRLRRLLIDPETGELLDLTQRGHLLAATNRGGHSAPVELHVTVTLDECQALSNGTEPRLAAAVDAAPPEIQAMLAAPSSADGLDARPHAYPTPTALADFVATRDRHPTNPCAGPSAARAADLDHTVPVSAGGMTVRDNLATMTRRWHRLRTLGGWSVERIGRGWRSISPTGRAFTTTPHDYRLGP